MKKFQNVLNSFCMILLLGHQLFALDPIPVSTVVNPCLQYTLINSVDFHPKQNLFCITYTQANKVILYQLDSMGIATAVQTLKNPYAMFGEPQHAIFSKDGERLIVANWTTETVTIYPVLLNQSKQTHPIATIPFPSILKRCKPHGITVSPCNNYLAIAHGASNKHEKAISLFRFVDDQLELINYIKSPEIPGTPKGITFSPDGTCLLVTFSDLNAVMIFDLDLSGPRQILQGEETGIFRPEDIKISSDGLYCAVSNSDHHNVTFYRFDKRSNSILDKKPSFTLKNPESNLCFPHGLAFSPDGKFLVVTEFGPVTTTDDSDIDWNNPLHPKLSKFSVFRTWQ